MVNNLMEGALSGMIVREEQVRDQIVKLLGSLPEELEPEEGAEPIGIVFAADRPVSVTFADGRFRVTIRGRKYARGDGEFRDIKMDVTAEYEIRESEGRFKAVRQGKLAVFPPGFVPGSGDRLSVRQQSLRTILQRKFGKIFQDELVVEDILLPEKWAKAGQLAMTEWEASRGWMTLAWRRVPAPEVAAAEPSSASGSP
jgi:hypothetical protein